MKIIIVGAGIGGLSTYLALKKHLSSSPDLSITLIESHASPSSQVGGGLGLAPNGLRVIASITQHAASYIVERAFPGSQMTFRNSTGALLGVLSIGNPARYGGYGMSMVPRPVVHEALLAEIDEKDVRWGTKVVSVRDEEEEGKVVVEYADGMKDVVDLVIGADGVRSMVAEGLFKGEYRAQYDGLTGIGGFLPMSSLPPKLKESLSSHGVNMTFGRKGFFGYGLSSPLAAQDAFIQWWSIYETPTIPDKKEVDYDEVKAQLLARHAGWKSEYDEQGSEGIFARLVELGCQPPGDPASHTGNGNGNEKAVNQTLMILPRFVTPRLPFWSNATSDNPTTLPRNKGRIILLGDAAHTMPPDVGQGVSCAVEDAVVYALLLKHYLAQAKDQDQDHAPLALAAKSYEAIRKPQIQRILDAGKRNGDMKKEKGWLGQTIRDFAIWVVCKLPESTHDYLFAYDPEAEVAKYLSAHP